MKKKKRKRDISIIKYFFPHFRIFLIIYYINLRNLLGFVEIYKYPYKIYGCIINFKSPNPKKPAQLYINVNISYFNRVIFTD